MPFPIGNCRHYLRKKGRKPDLYALRNCHPLYYV
jgi:hypothetical protein